MIYPAMLLGFLFCLAYLISNLALTVVGFFVIPVAILFGKTKLSLTGVNIFSAPRGLWLFGNDEDGYDPNWYRILHPTWGVFKRRWVWAAFRNSVNNLRFIKVLNPPPQMDKIQYRRWGNLYFIWQGIFCRFVYIGKTGTWYTLGWKYWTIDAALPCKDIRKFGVGFGARKQ